MIARACERSHPPSGTLPVRLGRKNTIRDTNLGRRCRQPAFFMKMRVSARFPEADAPQPESVAGCLSRSAVPE